MKKDNISKEIPKQNTQAVHNNIIYDSKQKKVRRREPMLSRIRKK